MSKVQKFLQDKHAEGMSYKELAEICSTTPKTMSNWINYHGIDLKWYSLFDICIGFNLPLSHFMNDTYWEKCLIETERRELSKEEIEVCNQCHNKNNQSCIKGYDKNSYPEDLLFKCEVLQEKVKVKEDQRYLKVSEDESECALLFD